MTVTCCETKGRRSTIKAEIRVINVNLTNANRKELWNLFGTKKATVLSLPRGSLIWTLIFSISISYKPDQYHCLLFEIQTRHQNRSLHAYVHWLMNFCFSKLFLRNAVVVNFSWLLSNNTVEVSYSSCLLPSTDKDNV